MSGKLKILTNGLLKENPSLRLVLGTCPTLAVTTLAVNGLGMLAWQAFFAHEIWFGSLPSPQTRRIVLERLQAAANGCR